MLVTGLGLVTSSRSVLMLDPALRAAAVAEFKSDYENYEWAKRQESRPFARFAQRSPFATASVEQLAQALCASDWVVAPEIQRFLEKKHQRVMATQANEDGMQRMRRREVTTVHKKPCMAELWQTLIDKPILTGCHKYDKLQAPDAGRLRGSSLPPHAYEPPVHSGSIKYLGGPAEYS